MTTPNYLASLIKTVNHMLPGVIVNPFRAAVHAFDWATKNHPIENDTIGVQTNHAMGAMLIGTVVLSASFFCMNAAISRCVPRSISSTALKACEWGHIAAMCWIVNHGLNSIRDQINIHSSSCTSAPRPE